MSNYSKIAANANRILTQKGQVMTLLRLTQGDLNPLDPSTSLPVVAAQCKVAGVVLPADTRTVGKFDSTIVPGDARFVSFRYVLLSGATDFIPQPDDVLLTAEGPYSIYGANALNPDGKGAIVYEVGASLTPRIPFANDPPTAPSVEDLSSQVTLLTGQVAALTAELTAANETIASLRGNGG